MEEARGRSPSQGVPQRTRRWIKALESSSGLVFFGTLFFGTSFIRNEQAHRSQGRNTTETPRSPRGSEQGTG
jgi:hypothetical protein